MCIDKKKKFGSNYKDLTKNCNQKNHFYSKCYYNVNDNNHACSYYYFFFYNIKESNSKINIVSAENKYIYSNINFLFFPINVLHFY